MLGCFSEMISCVPCSQARRAQMLRTQVRPGRQTRRAALLGGGGLSKDPVPVVPQQGGNSGGSQEQPKVLQLHLHPEWSGGHSGEFRKRGDGVGVGIFLGSQLMCDGLSHEGNLLPSFAHSRVPFSAICTRCPHQPSHHFIKSDLRCSTASSPEETTSEEFTVQHSCLTFITYAYTTMLLVSIL